MDMVIDDPTNDSMNIEFIDQIANSNKYDLSQYIRDNLYIFLLIDFDCLESLKHLHYTHDIDLGKPYGNFGNGVKQLPLIYALGSRKYKIAYWLYRLTNLYHIKTPIEKESKNILEMFKDIPFLNHSYIKVDKLKYIKSISMIQDENAIKFILSNFDIDIRILNGLLIEFSKKGKLNLVRFVLDRGADIHFDNDWALRLASKNGHLETVGLLLNSGANIHANYNEAFRWAIQKGHFETVELLLDRGANINADNNGALSWASKYGDLETVQFLLDKGADINVDALYMASKNRHLEIVKLLIDRGVDIHAFDNYALRLASLYGYNEIVKLIIDRGANIHSNNEGLSNGLLKVDILK